MSAGSGGRRLECGGAWWGFLLEVRRREWKVDNLIFFYFFGTVFEVELGSLLKGMGISFTFCLSSLGYI